MKRIVLFGLFLAGCTNSSGATRALLDAGYRQVVITGWSALSCSQDDDTCTGFTAIGPSGRQVSGAVGCGYFFKGCTIRLSE